MSITAAIGDIYSGGNLLEIELFLSISVHPLIQVPNQLVGAPIGSDVTLHCHVEASPKAINYWTRDSGKSVIVKYHSIYPSRSFFALARTFRRYEVSHLHIGDKNKWTFRVFLATAKRHYAKTMRCILFKVMLIMRFYFPYAFRKYTISR